MDYFANVGESWRVVRRERALHGLAAIEALHMVALSVLITLVTLPIVLLTSLMTAPDADELIPIVVDEFSSSWVAEYVGLIIPLLSIALALYVLVAVFSIAAQGGIVDQAYAALQGSPSSFSAGLRTGFRYWWRSGAVLAVPAMPSLVYSLVVILVLRGVVLDPLMAGGSPDPTAVQIGMAALSPLSSLLGIVALPLGVWATISLRFALVGERPWRDALSQGWRFARLHLKDVVLQFLALMVVGIAVTLVAEIALGLIVALVVVFAIGASTSGATGMAIAFGVVGALIAVAGLAAIFAALELLGSATWTALWSRLSSPGATPFGALSLAEEPTGVIPVGLAAPAAAPEVAPVAAAPVAASRVPPAFRDPSHVSQEVQ